MTLFSNLSQRYRFVRRSRSLLMATIDAVGWALLRLLRRDQRDAAPPSPQCVKRILLIQLDHFGDAVLTTSILPTLRRRFPEAAVDVLAAPWNWEVFSASQVVARIHISRRNRFHRGVSWLWPLGLLYWAWKLRSTGYDLAVDVRGDFVNAVLMWAAGIPSRLGWDCAGGGFLLTHSAPFQPGRHEVHSRHALLTTIGARPTSGDVPNVVPTPDAEQFVSYLLGDFRSGGRPLLVLHVGAGTPAKTWPARHWRELLGRLALEQDARVILVGSAADRQTAEEITQGMFWPGVMDWTGRLNVAQLAALTRRCSLFIGGDSGPAHLAAAAGAKVLSIFSGTNSAEQWRPWGERVTVISQPVACSPCYSNQCRLREHLCMQEVLPARVAEVIDTALHGRSMPAAPHFLKFPIRSERRGDQT